MKQSVLSDEGAALLQASYPETPVKLMHQLRDHPLLTLDALVALATTMNAADVEYNPGNLPIGIAPDAVPVASLGIAETIRSIAENGSWMVLKRIEQNPAYRAMLDELLDQVETLTSTATGPMLGREGFIFISSPKSVTPFHFDPEHNILLQLRGQKVMTIFPADDEEIADGAAHEAFHLGKHHRNLPWHDKFQNRGTEFVLNAGEAVYVPVKAPHFVRNGDAVSISLSITWRSEWSYAEAEARALNHRLRKLGLNPAPPERYPARNTAKALANRAARRLGL